VLNTPRTENNNRQAIPEYGNSASRVWSRDVIRSNGRQRTVGFEAGGLTRLYKLEVDEAEEKNYRCWQCHGEEDEY
jgi:hypothetical protein